MSRVEGAAKKNLRWIATASAAIGLILGFYQAGKFYIRWKEDNEKVKSLVATASVLNALGDYASAWKNLEQALVIRPASAEVKSERVNTAMLWIRNIPTGNPWEEKKISDITGKLLPALIDKAGTSLGRERANAFAHIGWAHYLGFRVGQGDMKAEENFRNALRADSINVYAHAMWGFWMLFPGSNSGNITEAKKHFEAAKTDGREEKYLRQLRLKAFGNGNTDLKYEPEIIEVVNEMRVKGDTIKFAERNRIVTDAYYADEKLFDSILVRLTPEEDLETFLYLTNGINADERLYLQFVNALFLEKVEDYKGALSIYLSIVSKKSFGGFKYKNEVRDGIRRLYR